jgi:hypothetical protein
VHGRAIPIVREAARSTDSSLDSVCMHAAPHTSRARAQLLCDLLLFAFGYGTLHDTRRRS